METKFNILSLGT